MTDRRAIAFAARLAERGIVIDPVEMDASTHTAQQAAAAIGCSVAAIVKSLLFVVGDEHVLVLASGPNRVDIDLIAAEVGRAVEMADAKTVKKITGSSIGGVPPLGHPEPIKTFMDETLLALPEVWAAAASSTTVFGIDPARLAELTAARVVRVS